MRFLCDEMFKGLARWLRIAGYDTVIAEAGGSDRELLQRALNEQRYFITRDKKLLEFRHADRAVLLLHCSDTVECMVDLGQRLKLDWLYKPFSRCLLCNTQLQSADASMKKHIPRETIAFLGKEPELLRCQPCDKLYWHGSHVDRMMTTLIFVDRKLRSLT